MTRPPLEAAAAPRPPSRVGQFWYYFDDDRWVWSDGLAAIHGYPSSDAVTPTRELMLAHKHPDDKARVEQLIDHMRSARRAFSGQHRVIDVEGRVVPVVVVADTFTDETGQLVGTTGFYVALAPLPDDGHPPVDFETQQTVQKRVDEVVDRRAVIEQAKGVLRLVYRLDDEQAFDLLTWRSQETNTKVHDVAAAICQNLASVEIPSETRAAFDHLLLTAHERELETDA
jgi:PAS domain-containing protein